MNDQPHSQPDPQPEVASPTTRDHVSFKELFSWAMYDFANSSYTTVIISAVYAAFFTSVIVPPGHEARDTYWSIAIAASAMLAIILSPLVGAICDYAGSKKRYLFYATVCCTISTCALYFISPGDIWPAIALITVSNAAFMIGEAFCGSFLTDLADETNMGRVSGLAWGFGYMGGLASMLMVQFIIVSDSSQALEYIKENQIAAAAVGLFYLISSLPTFLFVKERSKPKKGFEHASVPKLFMQGIKEMLDTAHLVRENRNLFRFFSAFTIYMAGLEVIIKFIGIFAKEELGMEMKQLIILFLIIQFSAAIGAVAFGYLEKIYGAKKVVLLSIGWWLIAATAIYGIPWIAKITSVSPQTVFLVIASIAGSGLGSIQSSSRAVVGLLTPPDRSAQMFGFWGMFSRVAIILGMLYGPLSDYLGSRYNAIFLVIGFFLIGAFILNRTDIRPNRQLSH